MRVRGNPIPYDARTSGNALAAEEASLTDPDLSFETLAACVPDALLLVDLAGRCLNANHRALDLLGYEREALAGAQVQDILGFWPPEIIRTWQPVPAHRADGRAIQLLMSAAPLPGTSGSNTRFVVLLRPLQGQGGDEAAFSQLAALVTSSPFPIVGTTPDGVILSWNPAAERLYGYATAEAIGEPIEMLLPPELQQIVPELLDSLRRGALIRESEAAVLTKDGRRIDVSFSAAPVRDASGNIIAISSITRDITAQLEAERTLRLWDRALNAAPSGIIVSAPTGRSVRIVDVNPAFEAITGYSREEILGRNFGFLEGPATDQEVLRNFRLKLQAGQDVTETLVNYRKDGTPYWAEVHMAPVRDEAGAITNIVGIHTDVTARREAEQALRLRDRALAAAPSGIVISALSEGQVHIVDVNPAFEAITGYSREEVLGRDFRFLEGPETDPAALQGIAASLLAGQDAHETLVNYRKDGTPYWAEVQMALVRDEAGAVTHVVGIHTDVTASREAEVALRLWDRARNAAPSSIVVTDAHLPYSRIIDVNPAFEAMTGYTREEVLGRDFGFLRGPDTDPEALSRLVEGISTGREVTETLVNYRKDGTPYWVELHISTVRNERDEITNYVAIQVDVTDRMAAEEALARERDLLTALMHHLPDAVYVKDNASRFLRLNQATAEELGILDPVEAIGKTDHDFFPAALADEYRADEQALLQTGEPMLNKTERQTVAGEEHWVLATKAPLRDPRGNVIGLVGSNRDITGMLQLQAERDRLHAELQAEIQRTAEIQAQLLPQEAPDLPGYEFAGACLAARQVGGDFFDWYQDDDGARLSLGDVMGKGLPASLLTATVRAALRSVAYLPVSAAMEAVNRALYPDLSKSESFITLFHASLQAESGEITYVDAGHGLALVLRGDGSVEPLHLPQIPLGVLPDTRYPAGRTRLLPDDTLVIYSDGLPDSRPELRLDPAGIAARLAGQYGAAARLERLVALATEAGTLPDDLTLVVVSRH